MPRSRFLDYEVALLLAKYGKTAVLDALARKVQLTPGELEAILQGPVREKPAASSRKKPSLADLVAELAGENPGKAEYLRILYARFGNRTFLPELRDVRRFLEEHDRSAGALKSRADTATRVVKLLADLDVAELQALCQTQPENAYSSLGVISDEILRHNR
ncbi:MAG TPA: hypothetical protein VFA26_21215 [Gemmataceae bacterium]|nr:hypothetical protein [Gemmataceae bacterium]